MSRDAAPPAPSRVRLVRPGFYRSQTTGALAPDVRDLLLGLATMADDEGWLVWRPAEIAATIYPYAPIGRRVRDLERRSAVLVDAELLIHHDCGCSLMPTLKAHHATKGGVQSSAVWAWHVRHRDESLQSTTDISVSSSVTATSSSSSSVTGSLSLRALEGLPAAVCGDCGRPTKMHAATCPVALNPHLAAVR